MSSLVGFFKEHLEKKITVDLSTYVQFVVFKIDRKLHDFRFEQTCTRIVKGGRLS